MKAIEKLIEIASPAFSDVFGDSFVRQNSQVKELLAKKNGFFAFESALRVFSTENSECSYSLDEWNSAGLWRDVYGELVAGMQFFAEDIFGNQFCVKEDGFYSFESETADLTFLGGGVEEWAEAILDDYNLTAGYSLAHAWQMRNGVLCNSDRLMPKIPFVCGGEFDLGNLVAIESARSMRCRGNLAVQIQNIADGEQVEFKLVD